jgi:hypothetical protein
MSHRVPGILMCLVALAPSACGDPVHSLWVSNQSANAYVVRASLDGQMRVVSVAPRVEGELFGGMGNFQVVVEVLDETCQVVAEESFTIGALMVSIQPDGTVRWVHDLSLPPAPGIRRVDSLPTAECLTSATGGRPSLGPPGEVSGGGDPTEPKLVGQVNL